MRSLQQFGLKDLTSENHEITGKYGDRVVRIVLCGAAPCHPVDVIIRQSGHPDEDLARELSRQIRLKAK